MSVRKKSALGQSEVELKASSVLPSHFGLQGGAGPVRRWTRRGLTSSWDGYFASQKAEGFVRFESLLERDGLTLIEADPQIQRYAVQAHTLTYWASDGRGGSQKRSYTPDVVAQDRHGQMIIVEMKAGYFARGPKWSQLEPDIRRAYQEDYGARFVLLTEADIRLQPRLSNCQVLLRHRAPPHDEPATLVMELVLGEVADQPSVDTACLRAAKRGLTRDRSFSALMRMALKGRVSFDMSRPINGAALVLGGRP